MKKIYVYFFGIIMVTILLLSLVSYTLLKPSLTLKGEETVNIKVYNEYKESGYIAKYFDEDLTNEVNVYSNLNTNVVGTYKIKYKLNNSLSMHGIVVERTINVIDDISPTIELLGDKEVYLKVGENYDEPGYIASDNYDGDITNNVEVSGNVDNTVAGIYTLVYNVEDSSGNVVSDMRTIIYENNVTDNTVYYTKYVAPINITTTGSKAVVEVASSQIGNIGGYPFWTWYGFKGRVEWCAVFVSWVANKTGDLQKGIIPKFAYVPAGQNWFKSKGLYQYRDYTPKPGEIIFFDFNGNGVGDHVGIVEYVYNGKVYTIEGNDNDKCSRKSYSLNSKLIDGYGTPLYEEPTETKEASVEETKEEVTPIEENKEEIVTTQTEEIKNDNTTQTSEN